MPTLLEWILTAEVFAEVATNAKTQRRTVAVRADVAVAIVPREARSPGLLFVVVDLGKDWTDPGE